MKYEKEAKQLIKDLFYEEWMDNEDWNEFIRILFELKNISYQKLAKQIEIGVSNGYSVDKQINLCKIILSTNRV